MTRDTASVLDTTTEDEANAFVDAYIDAMWWANAYEYRNGELEPAEFDAHVHGPMAAGTEAKMVDDAIEFAEVNRVLIRGAARRFAYDGFSQAGLDYALTRNGHGAGFWDSGIGLIGDALTARAKAEGESHLMPDDDGMYHVEG